MAEPFVRPDVRLFLDYLNNLPGPRAHEAGPAEAEETSGADGEAPAPEPNETGAEAAPDGESGPESAQ